MLKHNSDINIITSASYHLLVSCLGMTVIIYIEVVCTSYDKNKYNDIIKDHWIKINSRNNLELVSQCLLILMFRTQNGKILFYFLSSPLVINQPFSRKDKIMSYINIPRIISMVLQHISSILVTIILCNKWLYFVIVYRDL